MQQTHQRLKLIQAVSQSHDSLLWVSVQGENMAAGCIYIFPLLQAYCNKG